MNTKMTGFIDTIQKSLRLCPLDESSLKNGRVNTGGMIKLRLLNLPPSLSSLR